MTIIFYVVTLLLVLFNITQIGQSTIGGLIMRLIKNPRISSFLGSLIMWFVLNILWYFIEGGYIPILVLGLSIVIVLIHGLIANKKLTQTAKEMMVSELWAIFLFILFFIIRQNTRWV